MNKKAMKISVVIPAYNEADYLPACLDALQNQTVSADEIIVIDNNSVDQTASIARSYKNVRLIREKKQGVVYARNKGFNVAGGDIIARIDADTVVAPNWIETVRNLFGSAETMAVTGTTSWYDAPFSDATDKIFTFFCFKVTKWISGQPMLWGSNMAIRRDVWLKVRRYTSNEDNNWEDLDLTINVGKHYKIRFTYLLKVGTSFRHGKQNISTVARYFRRWPRTYAPYSRKQALLAWIPTIIITIGSIIVVPLNIIYDRAGRDLIAILGGRKI